MFISIWIMKKNSNVLGNFVDILHLFRVFTVVFEITYEISKSYKQIGEYADGESCLVFPSSSHDFFMIPLCRNPIKRHFISLLNNFNSFSWFICNVLNAIHYQRCWISHHHFMFVKCQISAWISFMNNFWLIVFQ